MFGSEHSGSCPPRSGPAAAVLGLCGGALLPAVCTRVASVSSSVEMRAGVCVTSPRLCWETRVLPCALVLLPAPPTVVFLTRTPCGGSGYCFVCLLDSETPPTLRGGCSGGWVWSEPGGSAEGGGERPCSFPLPTRELACSDHSRCSASPVLPRTLLFCGRSVELSLEAGTSSGARARSAPAALGISGIPARWAVCAVIRHPDSGVYAR